MYVCVTTEVNTESVELINTVETELDKEYTTCSATIHRQSRLHSHSHSLYCLASDCLLLVRVAHPEILKVLSLSVPWTRAGQ